MGYSVKLYDIVDPGFISLTSEKIVFNFLGYAGGKGYGRVQRECKKLPKILEWGCKKSADEV